MGKDTKKDDLNFSKALASWKGFLDWLRDQSDENIVRDCIIFEIKNSNRPMYIDRARTRFNKLRTFRELKELEDLSGKTISLNYVGVDFI